MDKYRIEYPTAGLAQIYDDSGHMIAIVIAGHPVRATDRALLFVKALEGADAAEETVKAILGQGRDLVQEAVKNEREQCAKVAENYGTTLRLSSTPQTVRYEGECTASGTIARLIRSRSQR